MVLDIFLTISAEETGIAVYHKFYIYEYSCYWPLKATLVKELFLSTYLRLGSPAFLRYGIVGAET